MTDPNRPDPAGVRPGGRTARTREAVLSAAQAILADTGIEGLTWDALAERSGANRSTIYRRWGSLGGVVADLAAQFVDELTYPETGTLAGDLDHVVAQIGRLLTSANGRMVQALLASRDAGVERQMERFWLTRRAEVAAILQRHGATADPALVVRQLAGPLYYSSLVENRPPDQRDVAATVAAVMHHITTARPATTQETKHE